MYAKMANLQVRKQEKKTNVESKKEQNLQKMSEVKMFSH